MDIAGLEFRLTVEILVGLAVLVLEARQIVLNSFMNHVRGSTNHEIAEISLNSQYITHVATYRVFDIHVRSSLRRANKLRILRSNQATEKGVRDDIPLSVCAYKAQPNRLCYRGGNMGYTYIDTDSSRLQLKTAGEIGVISGISTRQIAPIVIYQ